MADSIAIPITGETRTTGLTNLREGSPNRKAPVRRKLASGATLRVEALVAGEAVQGNAHWYRIDATGYVWTGACEPLATGPGLSTPSTPVSSLQQIDPALTGFGLDPAFAIKLSELLRRCRAKGLDFKIGQGLRPPSVQARYFCAFRDRSLADIDQEASKLEAKGAPWTAALLRRYRDTPRGAWQTDALPGAGWHQWGEAADCYCHRNGVVVGDGADPCYETYAQLAEELGLTAGLRFKKHPDAGHVQLRPQGGASNLYAWSEIDRVMQARFGDKPSLIP